MLDIFSQQVSFEMLNAGFFPETDQLNGRNIMIIELCCHNAFHITTYVDIYDRTRETYGLDKLWYFVITAMNSCI